MTPTNVRGDGGPTRRQNNPLPRLPDLEPGLTLLDAESEVETVLHALVVDHVLAAGGDACWVDTGTHARTGPLVEVAPSPRALQRVHVARAFTPFQHLALLDDLPGMLTDRTALVVVPDVDRYYRDGDLLGDEDREMLLTGLAALARVAREHDLPVLLTRTGADAFTEPVETAATDTLTCEATPFGPRFRAGGEETLVYPVDGGRWVQTTLAFWTDVLAAREPLYDAGTDGPGTAHGDGHDTTRTHREVMPRGAN